jgi:hypothetical protein
MACCPSHPGISHPESLRGNEAARTRLPRILPSVLPFNAPVQASLGFHRFEPVIGIVSPLSWAMLLTRQGISLIHVIDLLSIFLQIKVRFSLGPHPACRHADRTISSPMRIGVWRVVSEDSDNFSSWLFMIHGFGDLDDLDQPTRSEMSARPHQIHASANFKKLPCLEVRSGYRSKNGMMVFTNSSRARTQYRYICSLWLSYLLLI